MKRRIKLTFTRTRRTRVSEELAVVHVVCPSCLSVAESPISDGFSEAMENHSEAATVNGQVRGLPSEAALGSANEPNALTYFSVSDINNAR